MKKFLSLLLAAVLVLSLGVTAFATDAPAVKPEKKSVNAQDATVEHTFTFNKAYNDQHGNAIPNGKQPVEKLSFTITGNEVTNAPQISIEDTTTTTNANPQPITVKVTPAKTVTLGKYNYVITENEGNTKGVVYSQEEIMVQVMISFDKKGNMVETVSFTNLVSEKKLDVITNTLRKTDEPATRLIGSCSKRASKTASEI